LFNTESDLLVVSVYIAVVANGKHSQNFYSEICCASYLLDSDNFIH